MNVLKMADLDLTGKRVLIRDDLNVPFEDGEISSDKRIRAALLGIEMALEKGASVITVSPQVSEYSEKTIDKTGATFSILHDKDYKIMDDYQVSFHLDENTIKRYSRHNLDLVNGNEDNILPVPATFIIGKDGKIAYIHYDPNYKRRSTVAEIINFL